MKTIRITTTLTCDDDAYEKEIKALKDQILDGSFQREMKHSNDGFKKVTATIEIIKEK